MIIDKLDRFEAYYNSKKGIQYAFMIMLCIIALPFVAFYDLVLCGIPIYLRQILGYKK
jgi:hypothetical protein